MPKRIAGKVNRALLHDALDHLLDKAQESVQVEGISELCLSFENHPSKDITIFDDLSMDCADEFVQFFSHKHEVRESVYGTAKDPIVKTSVTTFTDIDPD